MSATEQRQIVGVRWASQREGKPVLQRQKAPLAAATPFLVDESALRAVALPDGPDNLDRNVTRAWLDPSRLTLLPGAQPLASLLLEQRIQRPFEDRTEIAGRDRVTQKLAGSFELVVQLGAGRELDAPPRG